jgi:uncharacterized protein (TIGR03067 family)
MRSDAQRGRYHFRFADTLTIFDDMNRRSESAWSLDDAAEPRRIELEISGGRQKAIYKLEGDFLTLYYRKGAAEYPVAFPTLQTSTTGELLILENMSRLEEEITLQTELTPDLSGVIAKHRGNLTLLQLKTLSPEVARELATKQGGTLSLEISSLSTAVASELSRAKCGLRLDVDEMSVEVASVLVRKGGFLALPRLRAISLGVGAELAKHPGDLSLGGIESLSQESAAEMARYTSRSLSLDGITKLEPAVAAALARYEGTRLSLNGIRELAPDTAVALQSFDGEQLDLNGLRGLSFETAEALVKVKTFNLNLNGLETISPEVAAVLVTRCSAKLAGAPKEQTFSIQGLKDLPIESERILKNKLKECREKNQIGFLVPTRLYQ